MELTEEQLQEKIDEATKELKNKNSELIGDIKTLKKTVKAFDGIDLDLLQSQSNELKELKEKNMTEAEKLEREQRKRTEKYTATKQALLDSQNEILRMKKENAVANALRDAGQVQEGMGEALSLLINQKITMSDANVPMIGEKTVSEYVMDFSTNEGKNFFVPKNAGGGGQGSGGAGGVNISDYTNPDGSLNNTKMAQLRKSGAEGVSKANDIVKAHSAKNK